MKRIITIIGLTLLVVSCSKTPQQQAEENIKEYLLKN